MQHIANVSVELYRERWRSFLNEYQQELFCPALVQAVLTSIPITAQIASFAAFANVDLTEVICDELTSVSKNSSLTRRSEDVFRMDPQRQTENFINLTTSIAYNPAGDLIAAGSVRVYSQGDDVEDYGEAHLYVIKASNGQTNLVLYEGESSSSEFPMFNNLVWSQDGNEIFVSTDAMGEIWRFDVNTGQRTAIYRGLENAQYTSLHPSDDLLVSVGGDASVTIHDVSSGEIHSQFEVSRIDRPVSNSWAAWSPNASQLAVGSSDGRIRLFDATTYQLQLLLNVDLQNDSQIESAVWLPNSELIAVSSTMSSSLWTTISGTIVRELFGGVGYYSSLTWDASSQLLIGQRGAMIRFSSLATGQIIYEMGPFLGSLSFAVSSDGSQIAIGSENPASPILQTENPYF